MNKSPVSPRHINPRIKKTLSPISVSVFLCLSAGLAIGCSSAWLLRSGLYSYVFHLYDSLLQQLQTVTIDTQALLLLSARKHMKYFLLLWFFAFTNVWKYYFRLFAGVCGFHNGLLASFCVQLNGVSGIAGFLCFLMPQCLLLIPAFLIACNHGDDLHRNLHSITVSRHRLILCEIPYFLIALALLLLGCLAEAAANPAILRLYFR